MKMPYLIIIGCALSYVFFFQNCSNSTNFSQSASSATPNSETSVTPTSPTQETASSNLTLEFKTTHIKGSREFLINVKGLKITDSLCRLQYLKNGTAWTDFSADFLCNTDTGAVRYLLPAENNWTNNFNATGVQIRMVKATDKSVIGVFPQNLTCATQNGALSQTPNIDENCNGQWDDAIDGAEQTCEVASNATVFGSSYSCEATSTCLNKPGTFKKHLWQYSSGMYSSSDCHYTSAMNTVMGPLEKIESMELTGTTPPHHHLPSQANQHCESYSGYDTKTGGSADGYTYLIPQWISSNCVYGYFPNKAFY